jgi:hypothetical protein
MSEQVQSGSAGSGARKPSQFNGDRAGWHQFEAQHTAFVSERLQPQMQFYWQHKMENETLDADQRNLCQGLMESCKEIYQTKMLGHKVLAQAADEQEESDEETPPTASAKKKKKTKKATVDAGEDDELVGPSASFQEERREKAIRKIFMLQAGLQEETYQTVFSALEPTVAKDVLGDVPKMHAQRGSMAIAALYKYFADVDPETGVALMVSAIINVTQAKTAEDFIKAIKTCQHADNEMGASVPTEPCQLMASVVLYVLKISPDPTLVNIANSGVATRATLAELGTSIKNANKFKTIAASSTVKSSPSAAGSYMGAVAGFSAVADHEEPLEACSKCKKAGVTFFCKRSEWIAHAKVHHPLPPRGSAGGGQNQSGAGVGQRQKLPSGQERMPGLEAISAHVATLEHDVEVFAFQGWVHQLVDSDTVVTIGRCSNGDDYK